MVNPSGITICDVPKYYREAKLLESPARGKLAGVLIERLAPKSEARVAGMMVGDVAVMANQEQLKTHKQAHAC